jgi:hypothetical protein
MRAKENGIFISRRNISNQINVMVPKFSLKWLLPPNGNGKQQLQMINSHNDLHSQMCHVQTISTQ